MKVSGRTVHRRLLAYVSLSLAVLLLSSVQSRAAEDLLGVLSARSAQMQSVSGSFRQQRLIQQLPVALRSNGTFGYSSSEGVVWRTLQPVESTLSVTEQGLLLDGNAQQMGSPLFARLILKIFLGDVSALQQYFDIDVQGSLSAWRITLLPANEAIALQYQDIEISGGEFTEALVLNEPGGDSTHIDFYDVTVSPVTDGSNN